MQSKFILTLLFSTLFLTGFKEDTTHPKTQVIMNNHGETDVVLLDLYENPVKVNIVELRKLAYQKYCGQMSAWLKEYEELSKNR